MEQRNGRIDRHGQRADEVQVYHFVGKGFQRARADRPKTPAGDLEGDLEFLMRAAKKVEPIREDLGKVGPVIAEQVEEAMLGSAAASTPRRAERRPSPSSDCSVRARTSANRSSRHADQLDETRRELHLAPENIQASSTSRWSSPASRASIPHHARRHRRTPSPCPALPTPGSWAAVR